MPGKNARDGRTGGKEQIGIAKKYKMQRPRIRIFTLNVK